MLRKWLPWLAVLLGIAVVLVGAQYLASESGEVVVLRTLDSAGGVHETRLWVVDHDGSAWLRAGNPSSGWFPRLAARPAVELVRGSETSRFLAQPTPAARDTINELMQRKYGFADSYISFFFPRARRVPVRLVPVGSPP